MSTTRYWACAMLIAAVCIGAWATYDSIGPSQSSSKHDRQPALAITALASDLSRPPPNEEYVRAPQSLDLVSPDTQRAELSLSLKFEKVLTRSGKISYDQAIRILEGAEFESFMADALRQSNRDYEAARMTEIYADSLKKAFGNSPSLSMNEFGCGLNICIGTVTTYGTEEEERFSGIYQTLAPSNGTPAYSMIELPLKNTDGSMEHRFVFAADATMNGIGDRFVH